MGLVLTIIRRLTEIVRRPKATPAYLAVISLTSFGLTVTLTIPFGSILAIAVLLAPRRWRSIAFWSSTGSALGAVVIYLVVHHLGWEQFVASYPDVAASKGWQDASRWISAYGAYALLVFAALPIPQSPVLLFAGIAELPIWQVWLAVMVGKLFKYGLYSYFVARYPARFVRHYEPLLKEAHVPHV